MTTNQISTLRPGLLVSLHIRIAGNITYERRDIERPHLDDDGTTRARWETERVVEDAAELRRAEKVRTRARQLVTGMCSRTSFGLLCPEAWGKGLGEAVAEARWITDEFNRKARSTEVGFYVIIGRVAQDDVEAVRAINREVRDLMRDMAQGLKDIDVKRVREAAGKARGLGAMLEEGAGERVKEAIATARAAARKIVAAGDEAEVEIDREAIKKLNAARTTFLDLDGGGEVAAPQARGRVVDVDQDKPRRRRTRKEG